jgi:hypothetical protein
MQQTTFYHTEMREKPLPLARWVASNSMTYGADSFDHAYSVCYLEVGK